MTFAELTIFLAVVIVVVALFASIFVVVWRRGSAPTPDHVPIRLGVILLGAIGLTCIGGLFYLSNTPDLSKGGEQSSGTAQTPGEMGLLQAQAQQGVTESVVTSTNEVVKNASTDASTLGVSNQIVGLLGTIAGASVAGIAGLLVGPGRTEQQPSSGGEGTGGEGTSPPTSPADLLREWANMRDEGLIRDRDFNRIKERLLSEEEQKISSTSVGLQKLEAANVGDTTPPEVHSTKPRDQAVAVAPDIHPTATFSKDMDGGTINPNTFKLLDQVTGKEVEPLSPNGVAYDERKKVATFAPAAPLENGRHYGATITSDVKDKAGNALPQDETWHFTVAVGREAPGREGKLEAPSKGQNKGGGLDVNNTDTQVPEDLTLEQREQVIDQALVLVEQLYVHLPLKRAMHAVDPVQRLKLLKYRLRKMSERRFHDEMISIFMGLRDMHTLYTLPASFHGRMAVLGFRIQRFFEGRESRYMVTQVDTPLVDDPHFKPGVVVTHWNGVPVDRAVELNADRWAGSNPDARHARGLATMTVRPTWLTAPPDEEWVTVGYLSEGEEYVTQLHWRMVQLPRPPIARTLDVASDPLALTLGIDALVEAVQRTRKMLFAPEAMEIERQVTNLQARDASAPDHTGPGLDMAEVSAIPHALAFQPVSTPHGEFGYLRIFSFDVDSPDDFVAEVVRIVRLLPQNGLIVDVRGNGGGKIPAGERLLQIFTPGKIEPERLQFICTPLTLKLCEDEELTFFADWRESIRQAVETATPFSDGFPILPGEKDRCNSIGQQYHGPAVLITDALCYSTTDFFAAGWQDHGIGHILGTDANTGAGGANVVHHADLMKLLPDPESPIQPLPKETSFSVSIRRTTRVGERLGDPLEDLGVVPDERHYTTKNDILRDNEDLIAHAASILASLPVHTLDAKAEPSDDGMVLVSATVTNISRLDAYVDGRPRLTLNIEEDSTEFELPLDSPGSHELELRGFDDDRLVAARRIEF